MTREPIKHNRELQRLIWCAAYGSAFKWYGKANTTDELDAHAKSAAHDADRALDAAIRLELGPVTPDRPPAKPPRESTVDREAREAAEAMASANAEASEANRDAHGEYLAQFFRWWPPW